LIFPNSSVNYYSKRQAGKSIKSVFLMYIVALTAINYLLAQKE